MRRFFVGFARAGLAIGLTGWTLGAGGAGLSLASAAILAVLLAPSSRGAVDSDE